MQTLPQNIANKLEALPVIPFDGSEAFINIITSADFTEIFDYYKENYLPDVLKTKSELQQRISLYLNLTNQDEEFVNQTDGVLYRRPVPSIDEFLSNNYYMGYLNSTLYPYWREQLTKLFAPGSPIRKAIFSGCIGCLTEDTVVATLNGDKTIGELLNNFDNEWVLSYNTTNNTWEPDKIIDVFYSGYKDVYEIKLDNGEKIQCTSNHRFLTQKNKWVSIDNGLVSGLSMMSYNPKLFAKQSHKAKSIKYVGKKDVYDITTERNHNFALKAGIVAHNCGKSTVARKVFVYVLYRMLCLRYPRVVLGVDSDSTLASVIISMTLKQVYDTNLLPVVKLMEGMPCFQKVMSTRSFENFDLNNPKCPFPFTVEKSSGTIFFPDNIIVTCGSNQGHFTGYNVFNSFCDEINEKGVEEAIALLNTLDNRFSSRFAGSDLVFQSVVSSARSTNSPIGEYVRHLPKDDPSIIQFNPMLWSVKPDPNFRGDGTFFKVMVGNGTIPSKIVTDPGELKAIEDGTYEPPAGCMIIDVPTVYKTRFELQLDQSIQDLAGIATEDNNMVFRDTTKIEDENLCPELLFQANLGEENDLFQMLLDNTDLFEKNNLDNKYYLKRAPKALRYVHCDLSSSGECDTGLSLGHKEYITNEVTGEKETVYVLDFVIAVSAKSTIDLSAVEKFFVDLVVKGNVPIHTISCDQYQSEVIRQNWEKSGLFTNVTKESVDIKLEPYINASNLVTLGKIKIGKCPKLKKELETLVFHKGKVEKTTELKDMADALTGFIYNAQMNYYDVPQYNYATFIEKEITNKYEGLIKDEEKLIDLF